MNYYKVKITQEVNSNITTYMYGDFKNECPYSVSVNLAYTEGIFSTETDIAETGDIKPISEEEFNTLHNVYTQEFAEYSKTIPENKTPEQIIEERLSSIEIAMAQMLGM